MQKALCSNATQIYQYLNEELLYNQQMFNDKLHSTGVMLNVSVWTE